MAAAHRDSQAQESVPIRAPEWGGGDIAQATGQESELVTLLSAELRQDRMDLANIRGDEGVQAHKDKVPLR